MTNVYCPNCGKAHSEEARISHCLNCAHPFNVFLWKRAAFKREEELKEAEREIQKTMIKKEICSKCGTEPRRSPFGGSYCPGCTFNEEERLKRLKSAQEDGSAW